MTQFDTARARAETPGCASIVHFNNAGASLVPAAVLRAQQEHLEAEAMVGGYEAADAAADRVAAVYASVAKLINADPSEIAIMPSATHAWDMAFYSLRFAAGDRILTSEAEYAANYVAYLQVAQRSGAIVEVIPSAPTGETSPDALADMIDDRVKLISITHVPTNGGLINPAAEIGEIAKSHGILYMLDACQSVGQMPIDVQAIGCDFLSATGRKFLRGPRGTGFLYVRSDILHDLVPPMIDHSAAAWTQPDSFTLRPDAKRFEAWEANYAAKLGLGAAVDYALSWDMPEIWKRVQELAGTLRDKLETVPGVTLRDIGRERCGIVSFTIESANPDEIKLALRSEGINLSVSRPSSTLLDATRRALPPVLRASVHYYNTEEEIDILCERLKRL